MIADAKKLLSKKYLFLTLFFAVSAAILLNAKKSGLYVDIELLALGEEAPNFKLERLDMKKQQLSEMRGAVVWIIFGRTDDDHDRTVTQLKEARDVAKHFREWDLRILFLSQSQSRSDLQQYVDENGCAAAIMLDKGNRIAAKYHVDHHPTSYLIDKTGFIRSVHRGLVQADDRGFMKLIEEHLRSGTRNAPKK